MVAASDLSNHTPTTELYRCNIFTECVNVTSGILQGSHLGPLLPKFPQHESSNR